ncbi:MFS transporter [Nocardia donostiensis]|uniref:Major facilitator superfamily (MFS) profile domain-containing protein n=1 Tax=Nocardia donostiensis TaxID=1538463 RepID=A0A1W0B5D3_9NOCA|nr:MFS transporter [Nocardia donostiensis]ONM48190.1 hypothetical protein B0T46_14520 [Nocardia donostiensis]OQS17694.1 hypothetical protein B0T44_23520 [Nocardia donostiensis]
MAPTCRLDHDRVGGGFGLTAEGRRQGAQQFAPTEMFAGNFLDVSSDSVTVSVDVVEDRQRLLTGALVTAMTLSMLPLFLLGALALAVFAVAPSYPVLVVGIAVSGLAQALANPVTNKLILTRVVVDRRGPVMGWKQSGVQLGAFLAGVPLAAIAAAASWRWAVAAGAAVSMISIFAGFVLSPDANSVRRPTVLIGRPGWRAVRLGAFSVLLGGGISAINTYLPLYGIAEFGMAEGAAAALLAVLGAAGIAGRVWWTRRSAALGDRAVLLGPLAVGRWLPHVCSRRRGGAARGACGSRCWVSVGAL